MTQGIRTEVILKSQVFLNLQVDLGSSFCWLSLPFCHLPLGRTGPPSGLLTLSLGLLGSSECHSQDATARLPRGAPRVTEILASRHGGGTVRSDREPARVPRRALEAPACQVDPFLPL